MHISPKHLLAGAVVTGGVAVAVAVPALGASSVSETLSSFKITGGSSAKAGTVTFKVRNSANIGHEMVVIKTGTKAAKLKISKGRASEKGSVGEVELKGGQTKTLKLHLAKGHYALICNIPGHYMDGMHKDFTVS